MAKVSHHREKQKIQRMAQQVQQATAAATLPHRTKDSYQNFSAAVGLNTGNQADGGQYGFNYTSRNRINIEAAYRSSWICGLAVDVVADDMTRAGVEFQSDELKPKDAEKLHRAIDQMCIWDKLSDAVKWSRLYGGAIGVMLLDGQKPNTPLNMDTVRPGQFKGIMVLDRWQIMPSLEDLVTDYGPDLGQPKYYNVFSNAPALRGERIHYSRIIRLDGLVLPYQQKIAENGWGQSVLERLWDRITAFDSTTDGAAQLVYKAHLRTYKIKGLRSIIATGGKLMDGLVAQMEMVRKFQSNEGLTLMDAEDEFEALSYTFAGLDNVLLQLGQQIAGATQIPLVRLFGQSPAGLNSTGDSDLRTYYDGINKQQNSQLRSPLSRLFAVLSRSVLGMQLPEGFGFEFVSLWQMTDEQKANVTKSRTEAVVSAEGAGIISQQTALKELRQISKTTGTFTHITDEDINAAESEPPKPGELDPPMPDAGGAKPGLKVAA